MIKKLEDFLVEYNMIFIIEVNLISGEIKTYGDRSKLKYDSILKYDFDYDDGIANLRYYLEDKELMPQMVGQGEVRGIICKPTKNIIVGLFYHNFEEDKIKAVKDDYKLSEEVDLWIKSIII